MNNKRRIDWFDTYTARFYFCFKREKAWWKNKTRNLTKFGRISGENVCYHKLSHLNFTSNPISSRSNSINCPKIPFYFFIRNISFRIVVAILTYTYKTVIETQHKGLSVLHNGSMCVCMCNYVSIFLSWKKKLSQFLTSILHNFLSTFHSITIKINELNGEREF